MADSINVHECVSWRVCICITALFIVGIAIYVNLSEAEQKEYRLRLIFLNSMFVCHNTMSMHGMLYKYERCVSMLYDTYTSIVLYVLGCDVYKICGLSTI